MPSSKASTHRQEILELIEQLNDAWVKGSPEKLSSFFREDMAMVHPDFVNRTEGREACIASYEDFSSQAKVNEFKLGETSIDVFGHTAVATYSYEISYEMGGEHFKDTGRDLFVFIRENDRWQAVWRTMIIPQEQKVN
jgi:ketosteroid isomerase-like protein